MSAPHSAALRKLSMHASTAKATLSTSGFLRATCRPFLLSSTPSRAARPRKAESHLSRSERVIMGPSIV